MYLEHFGFHRLPFTIAPDPALLFPAQGHQEALAHLHYALSGHGGLVCLTGEVGTGKTTLCRAFLGQLPDHVRSAYVFNPNLSATELLHGLCDEWGISVAPGASLRELYNVLNHELLLGYAAGQRFVCVIDEAQSMPAPLLEQVRLLTNLETDQEKLLTLILVGQPELRQTLARHDLRQLSQRITARYHLRHLNFSETRAYLHHRCRLAGVSQPLFTIPAVWALWRASGGIPRLLNSIADRALLGAYASGKPSVSVALVRGAQREILPSGRTPYIALLPLLVLIPLLGWLYTDWHSDTPLPSIPPVVTVPVAALPPDDKVAATDDAVATADTSAHPVQLLSRALDMPGLTDCQKAADAGWYCLWLEWPAESLRGLDAPVAVQIASRYGPEWHLLSSVSPSEPLLGAALLLWQGPADYQQQLIRPGMRDEVVRWVRSRLKMDWPDDWQVITPQGMVNRPDPAFYDPLLAARVEEFQRQHDLTPDRVIGPHTLLILWQEGL